MIPDAIFRENAKALIGEEVSKTIIEGAIGQSAVLSQFRRLPNMSSSSLSMPVLDMLPMAYWVNGDTGYKQTTKLDWDRKVIYAEELAVILPIPDAVLADAMDSGHDIFAASIPRLVEAFGRAIDEAVIFGINKPAKWRDSIVESAAKVPSTGNLYDDVFGIDGAISAVEESGFIPNGIISGVQIRGALRGLKDETGRPLFIQDLTSSTSNYALDGMSIFFMSNGAWQPDMARLILGDMSQAVYSVRQELTFKYLTEATIINPQTKEIVYALAQQDMTALRVVMRLGWEIPNPINAMVPNEADRTPFAVLLPDNNSGVTRNAAPASASTTEKASTTKKAS